MSRGGAWELNRDRIPRHSSVWEVNQEKGTRSWGTLVFKGWIKKVVTLWRSSYRAGGLGWGKSGRVWCLWIQGGRRDSWMSHRSEKWPWSSGSNKWCWEELFPETLGKGNRLRVWEFQVAVRKELVERESLEMQWRENTGAAWPAGEVGVAGNWSVWWRNILRHRF